MKKSNVLLLGIGISYSILALLQWIKPALFPISLYLAIAWASLCITIVETIKSINQVIRTNIQRMDTNTSAQLNVMKQLSDVLQNYDSLKSENEAVNAIIPDLEDSKKQNQKAAKLSHVMMMVENILTVIQIAMCGLMLIITPLKVIPNDVENNKVLGILGLISFALLFFSAYLQNKYDYKEEQEKQMIINEVSNYYLNLMEKMNEKHQEGEGKKK